MVQAADTAFGAAAPESFPLLRGHEWSAAFARPRCQFLFLLHLLLVAALTDVACGTSTRRRSFYEVLGVPAGTSDPAVLRQAYRHQALLWHPDKRPGSERKRAERRFRRIAEAFQVLRDPASRSHYDAFNGHQDEPVFDFSQFRDPEELFRELFGHEDPDDVVRSMYPNWKPEQHGRFGGGMMGGLMSGHGNSELDGDIRAALSAFSGEL